MSVLMDNQTHHVSHKSWDELEWKDSNLESNLDKGPNKMSWLKWKVALISSALLLLFSTSCKDKTAFENASNRFVQTEETLKKAESNLAKENEDVKEAQEDLKKEEVEAKTAQQEYMVAKKAHDDARTELKKIVWWL